MEWKNAIWVYCEIANGAMSPLSIALLGKGRELADAKHYPLGAVVVGAQAEAIAKTAITYGADGAIVVDNEGVQTFDAATYTQVLATLAAKYMPSVILIGATPNGRDLGGRLSAAMNVGLVADCTDVCYEGDDDTLTWLRPAYTGKVFAKIVTKTRPQLATVSDKLYAGNTQDPARTGEIITESVTVTANQPKATIIDVADIAETALEKGLDNADIVVGAGRGVGDEEGLEKVRQFAKAIGAGFGVSKPLVDNGWESHDIQIGITGKKIAPKVYIALGISGAIQHKLGIQDAELIIAINKDPDAPIFKFAHYGIVGDLFEALPVLEKGFKK